MRSRVKPASRACPPGRLLLGESGAGKEKVAEYIDVRIIAATRCDMQRMVAEGQFRQDLYYRLSAFPIQIPPLRQRREDIVALAEHFLSIQPEGERHIPLSSDSD